MTKLSLRRLTESGVAAALLCAGAVTGRVSAQDRSAPAILQWFESSYGAQENRLGDFFKAGYGSTWVPPTNRAESGNQSVGYDVYDRFDLGSAGNETLYGTETGLRTLTDRLHRVGGSIYIDYILNHNGFSDASTPDFVEAGAYPGFFIQDPDGGADPFGVPGTDGDFHSRFQGGDLNGRLAGLIDIRHETNFRFIRTPVDPSDPRNIPAGTGPDLAGRTANVADPANRRFYPDLDLAPILVFNPATGESDIAIHPFNLNDPAAGDAVPENATGLLARNARWLVEDIGVDGFRLDAARHFEPFVYDFFDQGVYRASGRTLLDGSQQQVFSFAEAALTDTGELLNTHIRKTIDPNDPGRVGANRDALDFAYFRAVTGNLQANGVVNDWRNVVTAGTDFADDGLINGSSGVHFIQSHDDSPEETGLALVNVGHAYTLLRPGNAVVYYNALEHGDGRDFPDDGRDDALGNFGDTITTLNGLRNTHGRGDYRNRLTEKETHVYERSGSALVVLSNRNDAGFDERRVDIDLPFGTPLVEYTGNAADHDDIPELLVVDNDTFEGQSRVTVRALRNDGQDQGYLVYGLAKPQSAAGIQLGGVSSVIGPESVPLTVDTDGDDLPDAPSNRDRGRARLTDLQVVRGESFEVSLATDAVTLNGSWLNPDTGQIETRSIRDRDADGDFAAFRINGGLDLNGSGAVDFTAPDTPTYGFENFTDTFTAGFSAADGRGLYGQTLDTDLLPEGENYLTVRVFRHRDAATGGDGGAAVFEDFKEVLYVDRFAPESEIAGLVPFSADGHDIDFRTRSLDGTINSQHTFLNLPDNLTDQQILDLVDGGNSAAQIDRDLFQRGYSDVQAGNNVLTVVSFEITGTVNVERFAGVGIENGNGLGIGDINGDGLLDSSDLTVSPENFETFLYSRNDLFNPAADVNGDGRVDNLDLFGLKGVLNDGPADQATLDDYRVVLRRRGNVNEAFGTDAFDIDFLFDQVGTTPADPFQAFLYDLDVDGVITQGDVDTLVRTIFETEYGDINLDGDVDVFQFDGGGDAQLLTSNLGFSNAAAADLRDARAADRLASGMAADTAAIADGTAIGTYDPATGEIVISIGSGIGVVGIESLDGERLVPANLTDALAAAQATAATIAFFSASGLETGTFNLGSIVAPGTDVSGLGFAYTPLGGSLVAADLVLVPEPATATLMLAAGLLATRRRRTAV